MTGKVARTFGCPTEFTLDVLGGKWKTVILSYLKQGPLRYADIRRLIPRLSDKMLTERLRDLTGRGLVMKKRHWAGQSREVYMLTPTGRSLETALGELYRWGEKHAAAFGVKVGNPLEGLERD
jgi:DNA-binding HxlR family transcriptional regulator